MKRHSMKGKTARPKALKGALKQTDTAADRFGMGNPVKRKAAKARDKRLERASV